MKLSHGFGLLAAGLGTVGLMVFAGSQVGCGSSSGGSGGGSSSGGASDLCSNLPASACNPPPGVPSGAKATTNTASHNYALHKLYLGDTDRTGVASMDAWKAFGYNLDGKVTSTSSTDVCKLVTGAGRSTQQDGNNGIDNSFGANIMPIVTMLDSSASMTLNDSINNGKFTVFTDVTGFDDTAGNHTNATGLGGVLLAGAPYSADGGSVPSWDTTTNWPVLPDPGLIQGCTPYSASGGGGCPANTDPVANAVIKFSSAYQNNGTFVNGTPAPLTLSLSIGGQQLALEIDSAVITFQPNGPGSVTNGIIAGVLDSQKLIDAVKNIAGNISTSLCMGSAFDSIAMQLQQASDIVLNGSTVSNESGVACNAISIGLGFESTEIAKPSTIAAATAPTPSKCADAGTD